MSVDYSAAGGIGQDEAFRAAATEKWSREEINVDGDAVVSRGDDEDGAFVAAWVWVTAAELKKWKDKNTKEANE